MFGRRPRYHNRGYQPYGQRQNLALLLLAGQLMQVGFNRIPPVTLVTILGQVAIFLKLIPLKYGWPSVGDICISSNYIIKSHDFKRLVTAAFFHLDDWHLYFNMVSFLWKGMKLEKKYGSPYFAYLLAVFTVLTNIVLVGLGVGAAEFLGTPSYKQQCAAGFSGVIFALKVLTTHESQGSEMVYGIPVPGPLVCWAELLIIQIIAPNASFIGHLSGIIVGLLYVKGPLKQMMDQLVPSGPSYTYQSGSTGGQSSSSHGGAASWGRPSYTYRSGPSGTYTGYSDTGASGWSSRDAPRQREQYTSYTGGLSEEEQMRRAMEESRRSCEAGPSPSQSKTAPTISPTAPAAPTNTPTAPPPAPKQPSAPPYVPREKPPPYKADDKNRIYPDLRDIGSDNNSADNNSAVNPDELRRRRLAKFT